MKKILENKVILITGASQGIGREIALNYAKQGATIILLGRNNYKLESIYDEIVDNNYPEPFAISFDLLAAKEHQFQELTRIVIESAGKLDGLVHSAAYFYSLSPIDFQTIEEWENQYRINVIAPMALTRALLPYLREAKDSSVIFLGDNHSETPKAYWGGFGTSKSAINYLCKVIADENSRFDNIRFNVLIPGSVNSPMRLKTHPGEAKEERKNIIDIMPKFIYWMSEKSKGKTGNIEYL